LHFQKDPMRKRICYHSFRVARNSLLFAYGLAATDRALLLGHDVQTNERYYSVYDQRNLDEIRKKLKEKGS